MFSDFYRMDFGRGSELLASNTNTNLTVTTQSAPMDWSRGNESGWLAELDGVMID